MAEQFIRQRVVFDCNALLQSLFSNRGPAAESLRLMEGGRFDLCISRLVLRELRAVLQYPRLRESNPNLSDDVIEAFIERLRFRAVVIRSVPHVLDFPRDHSDEPYLDLAIAARARYLVTSDNDIHWLATGYSEICKRFRRHLPSLEVITPSEFVTRMRG